MSGGKKERHEVVAVVAIFTSSEDKKKNPISEPNKDSSVFSLLGRVSGGHFPDSLRLSARPKDKYFDPFLRRR